MADNNTEPQAQNPVVSRFIAGLRQLESSADDSAILAVFNEQSSVGNNTLPQQMNGVEGAKSFWKSYRDSFQDITSRFTRIIEAGDQAALEWVSSGTLETGDPFEYSGVSVLSVSDDSVSNFMAYFDSRALEAKLAS